MTNKPIKSRAMDGMYRTDNEVLDVLSSMLGLTLGDAENGIWYIQDAGYKKVNHCYVDANNKKLYKCKVGTSSTSNTTDNFEELNLTNHSDRLDNLHNFEVLTSNSKFIDDNYGTVEYVFYGDFNNIISALPFDLNGPALETVAISRSKDALYLTAKNTTNQPETAQVYIVR